LRRIRSIFTWRRGRAWPVEGHERAFFRAPDRGAPAIPKSISPKRIKQAKHWRAKSRGQPSPRGFSDIQVRPLQPHGWTQYVTAPVFVRINQIDKLTRSGLFFVGR
jgi:hypothetical protein